MDAVRFGRSVRALRRRRRGWRQVDLAARAGISKSVVGRIEIGEVRATTTRSLERIADALGARVELTMRWNGEALDRLLDEAHAAVVDAATRLFRTAGWEVAIEVSFSIEGERGSIDLLGYHPPTASLAVVEVKSVVPDAGPTTFTLDRKVRLAPRIARERGWAVRGVARLLLVAESRTSRRRIEAHEELFRAALPVRGHAVTAWIREPGSAPPPSGLYFLSVSRPSGDIRDLSSRSRVRVPRPPASR